MMVRPQTVLALVLLPALVAGVFGWWVSERAQNEHNNPPAATSTTQKKTEETAETPRLTLSSFALRPGDTLFALISGASAPPQGALFDEKPLSFFPAGEHRWGALVGIDAKEPSGPRTLSVPISKSNVEKRDVYVEDHVFPTTKLVLPDALARQGTTGGEVVNAIEKTDTRTLDDALAHSTSTALFSEPFSEPLAFWRNVGAFGVIRQSESGAIRHLGVDLDAEAGEEVRAANRGVVRLSRWLPNYGNTVVLDHGLGVFTLYLHMRERIADRGELVPRGALIGRVGSTGAYSLEPHLHFSVKVDGASVDPRTFLDTANRLFETTEN